MQKRLLARVLPVFFILGFAATAWATTMLPLSLEDLLERSDIVARVRVGEVSYLRRPDAPFRVTELEVLEAFQGAREGEDLELWQRGDDHTIVIGDPILRPGQQGVAFLRREGRRVYLTALGQSFWWLEGEAPSQVARRDLTGIHILSRGETRLMAPSLIPWPSFRQLILRARLEVTP